MKTFFFTTILGVALAGQAAVLNVWCSVPPLVSIVEAVGGDRVQTESLMNSNQDPHTWSPSPKAVAGLRAADMFFTVGLPFEQTVAKKLSELNSGLRIINTAADLDTASDPHVWLSLSNLEVIAGVVETSLTQADPDGAAVYRQNCAAYQRQIAGKHEQLKQRLVPVLGRTFYIYHPALGYFAKDYGLNQGVVELEGKSPSPKQILGLIRRAREKEVRVVFVQPQFSDKSARILADRIGGRVVSLNPLAEDPVSVLEQAAESIVQSYAPRQTP